MTNTHIHICVQITHAVLDQKEQMMFRPHILFLPSILQLHCMHLYTTHTSYGLFGIHDIQNNRNWKAYLVDSAEI